MWNTSTVKEPRLAFAVANERFNVGRWPFVRVVSINSSPVCIFGNAFPVCGEVFLKRPPSVFHLQR